MAFRGKRLKKRLIIIGSLVSTVIVALILFCAITGFNIGTFIFGSKPSGQKVVDDTNLVTITKETPTDGSTPDDYNALDNFAFFAYKLEHSYYEATTKGAAAANFSGMNVDQDVYDYRLKSPKYILTDTRSTSKFVKIYHEQFFEGSKVLYRMGSKSNYDNMTIKARSNKQEFLLYGLGPEYTTGYIVCQETLLSDSGVVKNADGTYTTTYTLDPTVSPFYYQRKVKTNASISDLPRFKSVDLTYTYDSNWNIISANYHEIYSVYKMKSWVLTDNDITEVFTYLSDEEANEKMEPYYKTYKSAFGLQVPADDEVTEPTTQMTTLDYLGTMTSLIDKGQIGSDLEVTINNQTYNVEMLVDINKLSIQFKILDNYIIYKNNKLYLKASSMSYYELSEIASSLTGVDVKKSPISSNILDVSALIEGIMDDINSGTVAETDNEALVSITFNFGSYHIPTCFVFEKKDDDISFKYLSASYTYDKYDISLKFELKSGLEAVSIDDSFVERDLAFIINGNLSVYINDKLYSISLDLYLNAKSKELQGTAALDDLVFDVVYKDNIIYLSLNDNLYYKINVSDIKLDLPSSTPDVSNLKSFDINELIAYLKKLDITNTDSSINVKYSDEFNINGIIIKDINLSLIQSEYKDIIIDDSIYKNAIELKDLFNDGRLMVTDIIDILKSEYVNVEINNLSYDGVAVNANILASKNDLSADLLLSYKSYDVDVNIIYEDNKIYITALGQVILINISELDMNALDENSLELSKLVNGLSFTNDSINYDLSGIINKSLAIAISYVKIEDGWQIDADIIGIANVSPVITIKPAGNALITCPANVDLTYSDIKEIIEYGKSLKDLFSNEVFGLDLSLRLQNGINTYFTIDGTINFKLIDSYNNFNALINLTIIEYRNNYEYGWHNIELKIISGGTPDGMIYGIYGNNKNDLSSRVYVYTTYKGVTDLVDSIIKLMSIDTFQSLVDTNTGIDINNLITSISVTDSLNILLNEKALFSFIESDQIATLNITKLDNRISLIELNNMYVSYTNEREFMRLDNVEVSITTPDDLVIDVPTNLSNYINLTNMSHLFEALYNNANMEYFEIDGDITLTALSFINVTVPINVKIHVTESGAPEVIATLNIPTVFLLLYKKTLTIAYKDGYIYLNRVDNDTTFLWSSKANYFLKITYQEFMIDPLNYLLGEYGMGMPSSIMNLITNSESDGDGFVDAGKCVNSAIINENTFKFSLNMSEIADNSSIGDMNVTLSTTDIKNKNGETVKVLATIDEFTMKFVKVIELVGSGLHLSNIYDGIAHDVDMSSLDTFMNNYSGYEADVYYSGEKGTYNAGSRISHTITFDYMCLKDSTTAEYYKDDVVTLPYNVSDSIEINSKSYTVEGYYTDASYQHKIEGTYLMPAYDKKIYVKLI